MVMLWIWIKKERIIPAPILHNKYILTTLQFVFLFLYVQSTQICDADPTTCKRAHTFLIKTVNSEGMFHHTLAADSKEELSRWWEGFQQHLLDQGESRWEVFLILFFKIKKTSCPLMPMSRFKYDSAYKKSKIACAMQFYNLLSCAFLNWAMEALFISVFGKCGQII